MHDHVNTLPLAARQRGVTLTQVKRDPRFQSRLAHHAGITRTAPRPVGAARERRDSGSTSSRGGDSGDSSDDPEPGPGSGQQLDPAERLRTLQAFVAEHGLTYWDGHYGGSR
jgi:hypothetical protein